jgi:hypothetical protein
VPACWRPQRALANVRELENMQAEGRLRRQRETQQLTIAAVTASLNDPFNARDADAVNTGLVARENSNKPLQRPLGSRFAALRKFRKENGKIGNSAKIIRIVAEKVEA